MIVLVFGSAGQLGSELCSQLGRRYKVIPATRVEADITSVSQVKDLVEQVRPDILINSAAYTDVDGCESDQDQAFRVNALGARNAAIAAREAGAKLVHISTDYVFDGSKECPYREYDMASPINVYGASKLLGEQLVKEQLHRYFVVRTAWLYAGAGKSFVKTILQLAEEREELRVVCDQTGSPTYARDVARQVSTLMGTDLYGTYHCTSQRSCTWYEFARAILQCIGYREHPGPAGAVRLVSESRDGRAITLKPVSSEEFPRPASRPRYSVLENYMLGLQDLDVMPEWRQSLGEFLAGYPYAAEGGYR